MKGWDALIYIFYFALQCVTVDVRDQLGGFAVKVNDDSSLDYGDAEEMKTEQFRICFGRGTDGNCQCAWGKERMIPRFLT